MGMNNAFDFIEADTKNKTWNAREWFVVRKAEVEVTEDGIFIPSVKMGVEAREQVFDVDGTLADTRITRPNHPLVKYAESFTKNFDLIAERKSVVFHLRELAKASVMAKYLLESGIDVESVYFNLQGEKRSAGPMEIPQLWNEQVSSQVQLEDG
jgi:hypothetical protein